MAQSYFSSRKMPDGPMINIAADIMRHLFTRQYVGKALVICDKPGSAISVSRKQWLKIARNLQRNRAGTINADRILTLTSDITHMQHLQFVAKRPEDQPGAHVFFITPEELELLPLNCCTIYIITPISQKHVDIILKQVPADSLVVDYTGRANVWIDRGLLDKRILEKEIAVQWKNVLKFMKREKIDFDALATNPVYLAKVDDTLDTLLSNGHHFLQVASLFFRAYDLAQPAETTLKEQQYYDMLSLLARRVDTLTPGFFSQHLARIRNEQDPFLLFDGANAKANRILANSAALCHKQEGRMRLAQALISIQK